jgi:hypothetical protein
MPPPWLTAMQDELDQKPRLARFRAEHSGVLIREGFGFWQAVIPEPSGETVITRYELRDLLDKLDVICPDGSGGPPVPR